MCPKICLIGSGNVATHLAKHFTKHGLEIDQIWSRSMKNAAALAHSIRTGNPGRGQAIDNLSDVSTTSDFYFICVADQGISATVKALGELNIKGIVVHTSGSTDLSVFDGAHLSKYGVFYPLQTFSKVKEVDFDHIPLAIEAGDPKTFIQLDRLGKMISKRVFACSSTQRLALHVSAVLACNFTNHLFAMAEDLLTKNHLDFELIRPLIRETAEKALAYSPKTVQTGPAIRKDEIILNKHHEYLAECYPNDEKTQSLYQLISSMIQRGFESE